MPKVGLLADNSKGVAGTPPVRRGTNVLRCQTRIHFWEGRMKRVLSALFGAAAMMAVSAAPASASPFAFASATDNNLYRVDLATGTPTLIGAMGAGTVESLA